MGNCLVTKLKESVNNPDLAKVGELRFKYPNPIDYADFKITLRSNPSQTVYAEGGSFAEDTGVTDGATEVTVVSNASCAFKAKVAGMYLSIPSKYDITRLQILDSGSQEEALYDLGNISYCTKLSMFVTYKKCYGDVASLRNLTNLTSLTLGSKNILGNLSSFAAMYKLTSLIIYTTKIEGSLESLIEEWWSGGKRGESTTQATSVEAFISSGYTSFHNNTLPKTNTRHLLNFYSDRVEVLNKNNVLLGTYDGTSWTYA